MNPVYPLTDFAGAEMVNTIFFVYEIFFSEIIDKSINCYQADIQETGQYLTVYLKRYGEPFFLISMLKCKAIAPMSIQNLSSAGKVSIASIDVISDLMQYPQ